LDLTWNNLNVCPLPQGNRKANANKAAQLNHIVGFLTDETMFVCVKSFEDDSAPHGLHTQATIFVEANLGTLDCDNHPGEITLASYDPSHLEQRTRYQVVKKEISAGYEVGEPMMEIDELLLVLNLPSLLFSDVLITKMPICCD
jgi:hypothetical protein